MGLPVAAINPFLDRSMACRILGYPAELWQNIRPAYLDRANCRFHHLDCEAKGMSNQIEIDVKGNVWAFAQGYGESKRGKPPLWIYQDAIDSGRRDIAPAMYRGALTENEMYWDARKQELIDRQSR
jgi:hypothetical protein